MDIPLPLPLLIGGAEDSEHVGAREITWLPGHREKLSLIQQT